MLSSSAWETSAFFGKTPRRAALAAKTKRIRIGAAVTRLPLHHPLHTAEDLALTRRLCEVGDLVGIRILDHIVLGHEGAYRSLADEGLLGGNR